MNILRVTLVINAAIAADDGDTEELSAQIRAGPTDGSIDSDLVFWLLDGAMVRTSRFPE